MFNKLKQFKDLRSQGKKLQNTLSEEKTTVSSGGVSLTMDGNLRIISIDISAELLNPDKKEKLQNAIKDAHEEALKRMQKVMAMKVREMGGLPQMPGLS
ncbi:MAG: YbaB/EbfC family nucleoid-associated protein [Candidatus Magasanikbacteria bacterium]|nr:YbaB/EbfC family nucleoid-associated protein [Candidatus Magasanikbacteria bacterium]